jgi:glucuronyl/N-acetylglucosaminyl transferase EXT1
MCRRRGAVGSPLFRRRWWVWLLAGFAILSCGVMLLPVHLRNDIWELKDLLGHVRAGLHARCTLHTCFDVARCQRLRDHGRLTVLIYMPTPGESPPADHSLSTFYRAVLHYVRAHFDIVTNPAHACVFMPAFDVTCGGNNCLNDKTDFSGPLRRYPHWHHGRNHLLFEVSDWNFRHWFQGITPFDTDMAMVAKSGPNARWYRPGFDISIPLTHLQRQNPNNISAYLATETCAPVPTGDMHQRDVLLFYKGGYSHDLRKEILRLHAPEKHIILVDSSVDETYDFAQTMAKTRFGFAPQGAGLHSYRLMEVMQAGAIPVLMSVNDNMVP